MLYKYKNDKKEYTQFDHVIVHNNYKYRYVLQKI